jgi:hypothetical protein
MAMKDAERKAEEQAKMEAEQKAAAEAEAQKAAEEQRIATAVSSGAEKLMADVEAKMSQKDADHMEIVKQFEKELAEKSEEIQKMRESKRVFADRSEVKSFAEKYEAELVDAHMLGVITKKGWDTKLGKQLFEKVNIDSGVTVPTSATSDFESTISTALERDIELELILDPMFRKIQMNAASLVVPTMPDAGYASFVAPASPPSVAGSGAGQAFKGDLEDRDSAHGANTGIGLGSKVLTTAKLVSKSYIANETEEDAIIPVLPLIRESMVRAHARAIEHSLLMGGDGDDLISSQYNGLVARAGATVDVSTASPFATSGEFAASELLAMRTKMGKYGRRPTDVMFIVSLAAYYSLLEDTQFANITDVGSDMALKLTGAMGSAYGSPVYVCDEFPAAASGKVCAIAVNPRNFVVPVQRGATVETDYDVENQRRVLVATQRRGFDCMFADQGADVQVVKATW